MKVNTTDIQVRYQETDMMGVVYHANYLVWFEIGRTSLIEEFGFSYKEMEEAGIVSPVTDVQVSFQKPVRYGDDVHIKTWIEEYNGVKTTYGYEIVHEDGSVAVTGASDHVLVKRDTFRPTSLRKAFPAWHEAYKEAVEHS
ncbi:acyl-CoA thioesterase [Salimicrobium halophilum]|uniref:Acyl-CoA thioester hydrolase n=1 Tax=Salimicrobium halophilum TaxID=86666 RepID=A0A1G8Q597_9BACI|nr:thioesterase family protein [Salimicrobium halophilum]SDI99861.1 acyl-CoA thioester hydrolase [Salimicrobium halophilum]